MNKLEVPLIWIYNNCMMNERDKRVLEMFIEVQEEKGRRISMEEFVEDIENSIGWDEVFSA